MITRHHIALVLIVVLIPCTAFQGTDPFPVIGILAGSAAGSILPDVHMKRPKKLRLLTVAWFITLTGRRILMPVICGLYTRIAGIHVSADDKRLTHSIPGIILFGILCIIPAIGTGILFPGSLPGRVLQAFSGGIILGMIVHLVQDLCTRKGICPLFPFSELTFHGSIRPCDVHDHRIPRFHVQHISFFLLFHLLIFLAILPGAADLAGGIVCSLLCLILMVSQSDIAADRDMYLPSGTRSGNWSSETS